MKRKVEYRRSKDSGWCAAFVTVEGIFTPFDNTSFGKKLDAVRYAQRMAEHWSTGLEWIGAYRWTRHSISRRFIPTLALRTMRRCRG